MFLHEWPVYHNMALKLVSEEMSDNLLSQTFSAWGHRWSSHFEQIFLTLDPNFIFVLKILWRKKHIKNSTCPYDGTESQKNRVFKSLPPELLGSAQSSFKLSKRCLVGQPDPPSISLEVATAIFFHLARHFSPPALEWKESQNCDPEQTLVEKSKNQNMNKKTC